MVQRKTWYWKNDEGFTTKRKARRYHKCHICYTTILISEEYYQQNYFGKRKTYPICEGCWDGPELFARPIKL